MRKILVLLVVMLVGGVVFAKDASWQLVLDSATVAGTSSITSNPLVIGNSSDFSYCFTTHDSTATVDVKLEVQVIDSNQSNYTLVGSTSDASVDPNFQIGFSTANYTGEWVTINTAGVLVVSQGNDTKIIDGFALPVSRLFRFKVTGNATNDIGVTRVSLTLGRYGER